MSYEVIKDYGGTILAVRIVDGEDEYTISASSVMFDQYSSDPCLRVEQKKVERIPRCQAAVPRKPKDYTGNPRDLHPNQDPNELVVDQCKRAAKKGSHLCPQHQNTHSGLCDGEEYIG